MPGGLIHICYWPEGRHEKLAVLVIWESRRLSAPQQCSLDLAILQGNHVSGPAPSLSCNSALQCTSQVQTLNLTAFTLFH